MQWNETYLCTRDTQEANRHEHPANGDLIITKLDTVEILYTKTVCSDETVQGENLVHLDGRDEGTATLSDDMCD